MRPRITIRTLAVATALIALGFGWGLDRYRLKRYFSNEMERMENRMVLLMYENEMYRSLYEPTDDQQSILQSDLSEQLDG